MLSVFNKQIKKRHVEFDYQFQTLI